MDPHEPRVTFIAAEQEPIDAYKLLTGLVVPRPIGWVGSRGADGTDNLAPFSFFNAVAGTPPTVIFAPTGVPGVRKDTLVNVEASGEFTLSVVTADLLESMNATAIDAPAGVSEFEHAGLTAVSGTAVAAAYVGEAKAAMECRVTTIVDTGVPPLGSRVVFGEVLRFHIAESLLDGTRIDQRSLGAVGRHVGGLYSIDGSFVDLARPAWADRADGGRG